MSIEPDQQDRRQSCMARCSPVTTPIPLSFKNLVLSTFDWGMYCCLVLNFHRGQMDQCPPLLASTILYRSQRATSRDRQLLFSITPYRETDLAKTEGESKYGTHHCSTLPSSEMMAAVCKNANTTNR